MITTPRRGCVGTDAFVRPASDASAKTVEALSEPNRSARQEIKRKSGASSAQVKQRIRKRA